MSITATAAAGLQAAASQFESYAADTVRATAPAAPQGSAGPLALGGNLVADMVGSVAAMANYRANLAVMKTADSMAKVTIDLIG